MGIFDIFKRRNFSNIIQKIFGKKHAKIGIYGPPNVGKTTLANRILWEVSQKSPMKQEEQNGKQT